MTEPDVVPTDGTTARRAGCFVTPKVAADLDGAGDRWLDARWLREASDWVVERLRSRNVSVREVLQSQVRPWGTVLRVETDDGRLWFKGNAEGGWLEPVLMPWLHDRVGDAVPATVAVDATRRWWLARDGGTSLAEQDELAEQDGTEASSLDVWSTALAHYAELQRRLEHLVPDLVALGVPRCAPEDMPAHLARLLDATDLLLVGDPRGLSREEYAELRALEPTFARWCEELSAAGIPLSLQHDDLSEANICHRGGDFVFIDWADASVAHPFGSLIFPDRAFRERSGLAADSPEVAALHRRYLEAWTPLLDAGSLLRVRDLALHVAIVGKAMSWSRALGDVARQDLNAYYASPEARWLRKLLQRTTLS